MECGASLDVGVAMTMVRRSPWSPRLGARDICPAKIDSNMVGLRTDFANNDDERRRNVENDQTSDYDDGTTGLAREHRFNSDPTKRISRNLKDEYDSLGFAHATGSRGAQPRHRSQDNHKDKSTLQSVTRTTGLAQESRSIFGTTRNTNEEHGTPRRTDAPGSRGTRIHHRQHDEVDGTPPPSLTLHSMTRTTSLDRKSRSNFGATRNTNEEHGTPNIISAPGSRGTQIHHRQQNEVDGAPNPLSPLPSLLIPPSFPLVWLASTFVKHQMTKGKASREVPTRRCITEHSQHSTERDGVKLCMIIQVN